MPRHSIPNRRAHRRPLLVEALESRQLLTTYTVINSNNDGTGSFRKAIENANSNPGPDQIIFKVTDTERFDHYDAEVDSRTEIVVGPDGNIWFTKPGAIGRRNPDGTVTSFPLNIGGDPVGITAGPDGTIWFTYQGPLSSGIGWIPTEGGSTIPPPAVPLPHLPLPSPNSNPGSITVDSGGTVWFITDDGTSSSAWQYRPDSETLIPIPFRPGDHPTDITTGPDGAPWATVNTSSGAVVRHFVRGGYIDIAAPFATSRLGAIITGADGNFWITDPATLSIWKVSTSGAWNEYSLAPDSNPLDIVSAADGNIYFTDGSVRGIGQIDAAGVVTTFPYPASYSNGVTTSPARSITATADGKLYFTEPDAGKFGQLAFPTRVKITLNSPLPEITETVEIRGDSQWGTVLNSTSLYLHKTNAAPNMILQVVLDGSQAGSGAIGLNFHGLDSNSTANSIVSGLMITGFDGDGIRITDNTLNATGAEGVHVLASVIEQNGVGVRITSSNNRIGGNSPNFRTIVRNNGVGIVLEGPRGTGNRVEGTFIVGNAHEGVLITSSNNSIGDGEFLGGDQSEGAQNLISGNERGIRITSVGALPGSFAQGNEILGNRIGTDITGTGAWPNQFEGVWIEDSPGNVVGGLIPPSQNVILGNGTDGVRISGARSTVNRVLGNFIGFNESKDEGWITVFVGNKVGVRVESPGNTVGGTEPEARNVISTNKDAGIVISGALASQNTIIGNYIGTNPAGRLDLGNTFDGVRIENASDNTIGGSGEGEGNLISGNNWGVSILGVSAAGNRVLGNLIGTKQDGTSDLGNAVDGVRIVGAPGNLIGGSATGEGNVISGNNRGVRIEGPEATGNAVVGNAIGADRSGKLRLGNSIDGVIVAGGASNNRIGGPDAAEGNWIAFNHGNGVLIESGVGNAMLSNLIYANTQLAIDLGGDWVTPNDPGDLDTGANRLQNVPGLTAAISDGSTTTVQGTFQSAPNSTFTIQFFTSDSTNPLNNGEGQFLLGTTLVETDGAGNALIRVTFPNTVPIGQFVSATATSPGGDTSEFSNAVARSAAQVQFLMTDQTVNEDAGVVSIVVTRSGNTGGTNVVDYATSDGSAKAGQDYQATQGTLKFDPGETSKLILVPIVQDATVEGAELFTLTLSNPSDSATVGSQGTFTFTILSDDLPIIRFETATARVDESAQEVVLTVTRDDGTGTSTVSYTTGGGSAVDGADYTGINGVLAFQPGEVSKTLRIAIRDDAQIEPDETFQISLSGPTGALLGAPSVATVTIGNDDRAGSLQFAVSRATVYESGGRILATVTRTGGTVGTVTVAYATVNGSAKAGIDYGPVSGTLTFAPGVTSQTITVPIINDALFRGDRTLVLALSNPGGGASLGLAKAEVVTIVDDDRSTARFASTEFVADEDAGLASITVVRDGGGSAMVAYAAWGVSAVPGVHFQPVSGLLTFSPGERVKTFQVPLIGNFRADGAKSVHLALVGVPGGSALGAPNEATLTIMDNDVDPTPPTVVDVATIANLQAVTGFAVTFSEAMDPARAVAFGSFAPEITSAGADGRFNTVDDGHVAIAYAAYDPGTFRLFLLPAAPLPLNMMHRIILNPGVSPGSWGVGLTDLAGNLLDAGGIGVAGGTYQAIVGLGTGLQYVDPFGNLVSVQLARGGLIDLVQRGDGGVQRLRLLGVSSGQSVLSGRVTRPRPGVGGRTTLPAPIGSTGVKIQLSRSAFTIGQGQATAPTSRYPLSPISRRGGRWF